MKKRLCWLAGIVVLIVAVYLILPWLLNGLARWLVKSDGLRRADVIIVLAGDTNGERVGEAVKLYRQGYAPKILMSGGPLAWRLTAADRMKEQALFLGVPAKDILIEERSESTLDNARFSLEILRRHGAKSLILVTSPTHSRRARRVFAKVFEPAGIKVLSHAVPIKKSKFTLPGWWTRHEDSQLVLWELGSLFYYYLKGY